MTNKYDASSIKVLKGLEAVRKRPGMYIGSTDRRGLHHLIWEILDNSIDESLAGFCKNINIKIFKDGSISIEDDGRGMPVSMHSSGKSVPEVIFTVLHAGGKFDSDVYKTAGGLHGVGASVVNALSSELECIISRNKKKYKISFEKGGKIKEPLKEIGTSKKNGTYIKFKPDKTIFKTNIFSYSIIVEHCKEAAFLNNNLKINIFDEFKNQEETFYYKNGLKEYIGYINEDYKKIHKVALFEGKEDQIEFSVAFQYVNTYNENLLSFANNVKTQEGGSHVTGFRAALTRQINNYAKEEKIIKNKKLTLDSNDLKEGLSCIISVKVPENLIQYEGQTKSKLGTIEARSVLETYFGNLLKYWLKENPQSAKKIINKALNSKKNKLESKKTRKLLNSKNNKNKNLLGKLTVAQSKQKSLNELFIVEGDSAGGSAKTGRNRKHQAILSLRGKVINAQKSNLRDVLSNNEIETMIESIGGGFGNDFNIKKINYGKIIIMTDADQDGAHIQTLLLTFFHKFMKDLFIYNKLFIALAPLYKIQLTKKDFLYAWSEEELKDIIETKGKYKYIQRYKGLGEMNAEQLWDTTMDPKNRKLISIRIDDITNTEKKIEILMGSNAAVRKKWITENIDFDNDDNYLEGIK